MKPSEIVIDRQYLLELTQKLIEIPSTSGQEGPIANFLASELKRVGLDAYLQEVAPGRPNVIAKLKGCGGGPSLLFNSHIDTMPLNEGWTKEPYRAEVAGKWLYGAESNNMKASVAAMVEAMRAIAASGARRNGDIIFSGVVGECDSLGLGTVHMLRQGIKADASINGEPTALNIMTAHSGVTQLVLKTIGRSVHVYKREEGVDAIKKMAKIVSRLDELALTYTSHPDFSGLPRLNIGLIKGGRTAATLAPSCEAEIDVRSVPGMSPEGILADIERFIEKLRSEDPELKAEVRLKQEPDFIQEMPFHIRGDEKIAKALAEAHQELTGQRPIIGPLIPQLYFGTDASHLLKAGIPTVIYGPGLAAEINEPDEKVPIENIFTAAAVYARAALKFVNNSAIP